MNIRSTVGQSHSISRDALVEAINKEATKGDPFDNDRQEAADRLIAGLDGDEGETLVDIRTDASFKALNHSGLAESWQIWSNISRVTGLVAAASAVGGAFIPGAPEMLKTAGSALTVGGFLGMLYSERMQNRNQVQASEAADTAVQLSKWEQHLLGDVESDLLKQGS